MYSPFPHLLGEISCSKVAAAHLLAARGMRLGEGQPVRAVELDERRGAAPSHGQRPDSVTTLRSFLKSNRGAPARIASATKLGARCPYTRSTIRVSACPSVRATTSNG